MSLRSCGLHVPSGAARRNNSGQPRIDHRPARHLMADRNSTDRTRMRFQSVMTPSFDHDVD
jgi:hypothetical protein